MLATPGKSATSSTPLTWPLSNIGNSESNVNMMGGGCTLVYPTQGVSIYVAPTWLLSVQITVAAGMPLYDGQLFLYLNGAVRTPQSANALCAAAHVRCPAAQTHVYMYERVSGGRARARLRPLCMAGWRVEPMHSCVSASTACTGPMSHNYPSLQVRLPGYKVQAAKCAC